MYLEKACLYPGYSTAAQWTEKGLRLKVSFRYKFVSGKSCLDIINGIESRVGHVIDLKIREEFEGKQVIANYGFYNLYTIKEVCFDKLAKNEEILHRTGQTEYEKINLVTYYKRQYNKTIKPDQFLFKCYRDNDNRSDELKQLVFLVPELCILTTMSENLRKNDQLKRIMLDKSRLQPVERERVTLKIRELLNNNDTSKRGKTKVSSRDVMKEWGLEIGPSLEKFEGRILDPPAITYSNNSTARINEGKFRHMHVIEQIADFDKSNLALICSSRNRDFAKKVLEKLTQCSNQIGIRTNSLEQVNVMSMKDNQRESERGWEEHISNLIQNKHLEGRLAIILLDNSSKSYYPRIKKVCIENGVVSQVLTTQAVDKPLTVMSNIFLQILEKASGKIFKIPLHDNLEKLPSSVIGIDSTKNSISVSMTYNRNFSKYYSEFHQSNHVMSNEESSEILTQLLKKCILKFQAANKRHSGENPCPNIMLIYRTGKNKSGIDFMKTFEIPAVKSMINLISTNTKFMYISVIKQNDVRFLSKRDNSLENPPEGVVVDQGLTEPGSYEFYLQPIARTGIPTLFKVVYEEGLGKLPIEILEDITYKMSYGFTNWSGAIKIPACLKMAERVLTFTSAVKPSAVQEHLTNVPYFI